MLRIIVLIYLPTLPLLILFFRARGCPSRLKPILVLGRAHVCPKKNQTDGRVSLESSCREAVPYLTATSACRAPPPAELPRCCGWLVKRSVYAVSVPRIARAGRAGQRIEPGAASFSGPASNRHGRRRLCSADSCVLSGQTFRRVRLGGATRRTHDAG